MRCVRAQREISHPPPGPVREGGRDFRTGRPDDLTRWARVCRLLEQGSLPEVGTISGDIPKAPGFLKGPAGPLSRAPRLGSSGDFFGSFLVGQKGTYPGSANLPGNRPGGQPIHRQFPPAGSRRPPYGPPQKNTRSCDRAFVCRFQLNMTTSSLGFSPGSTLRAVSTGPVESGVWPW